MSGIAGVLHRNGAPAERGLLQAMAQFLSFRGPDARDVWTSGSVGLAHTMLRTTRESLNERQPATLDGRFTITADVRLDARDDLREKIEKAGAKITRVVTDPELILHAYSLWAEECVHHLRGDFAFALWDARRQLLFCARDHFGIKPFYYANFPRQFLFSNTLDCLRAHPDVSTALNHAAIADFLLFGLNCDAGTTTYRDIRRLPPAHTLTVAPDSLWVRRYWSPPADGRIRYRRGDEYVEHFQLLLQQAVSDRLRADRAGIFLSGGLDSGAVAATAREVSRNSASPQKDPDPSIPSVDLRAYTVAYETLLADPETSYARSTAQFLRIPVRVLPADSLRPFARGEDSGVSYPEPVDDPLFAGLFEEFRVISRDCRVILSGEGNDNLMHFEMWPHLRDLLRNGRWLAAFSDAFSYLQVRRFPWRGLLHRTKAFFGTDPYAPVFPRWFAPAFARRMNLEARWKECSHLSGPFVHPLLPKAHASLALPHWSYLFEQEEPGVTRLPVEVRYPFLDLRIVNFLLALPPFPYLFEKMILREAMIGRLPEKVRTRPKTPLGVDPLALALGRYGAEGLDGIEFDDEIRQFVDPSALEPLADFTEGEALSVRFRPLCLNFWLQSVRRTRYNFLAEARNG
jgi:asparagine synthase (glutamine-hydrolysing)